ncbi:hypothetical protein F5Y12DRAFT_709213 [Xylaria sp. FL1777]|nr:hypothetical protein F5Y12DRAFT_709213 [Xylaria sp. FL1777]
MISVIIADDAVRLRHESVALDAVAAEDGVTMSAAEIELSPEKILKPKLQFNAPEMTVRGILVGVGLVQLIVNALTVHCLLNDPNATGIKMCLEIYNSNFQSLASVVNFLSTLYATAVHITINFTAYTDDSSVLLKISKSFTMLESLPRMAPGPPTLKPKAPDLPPPALQQCTSQYDDLNPKHTNPPPLLKNVTRIVFTVRSMIANGSKPNRAKDPDPSVIPDWTNFSIIITEAYAPKDGQPVDDLEDTVLFVKAAQLKKVWVPISRGRTTKQSQKCIEYQTSSIHLQVFRQVEAFESTETNL